MAKKIDYVKYLLLGAAGALTPVLIGKVTAIADMLAKATFLDTDVMGVTIKAMLLTGVGVLGADMLYDK